MERQNNRSQQDKRPVNNKRNEVASSNRPMNFDRDAGSRHGRPYEEDRRVSGLDRNRLNDLYERSSI